MKKELPRPSSRVRGGGFVAESGSKTPQVFLSSRFIAFGDRHLQPLLFKKISELSARFPSPVLQMSNTKTILTGMVWGRVFLKNPD